MRLPAHSSTKLIYPGSGVKSKKEPLKHFLFREGKSEESPKLPRETRRVKTPLLQHKRSVGELWRIHDDAQPSSSFFLLPSLRHHWAPHNHPCLTSVSSVLFVTSSTTCTCARQTTTDYIQLFNRRRHRNNYYYWPAASGGLCHFTRIPRRCRGIGVSVSSGSPQFGTS